MPRSRLQSQDLAEREPHYEYLEPAEVRLFHDGSGKVRMVVEDDRCYVDVRTARAFPLSLPDAYIGLLDGRDKVIGLIVDTAELDDESQRVIEDDLRRRYFTPTISRVHEAKEEFGAVYFDVETEFGPRQFVAKGLRDALEERGEGELLLTDVDGNRYRFENWTQLDPRSRRLMERLV